MSRFRFIGLTAEGVALDGEISASSERAAMGELERRGLTVVELVSVDVLPAAPLRARGAPSRSDVVLALQGLSTLLAAGVGLAEAVESQASALPHPALQAAFDEMTRALRQGSPFSDALGRTALELPPYVSVLVRSGERAGLLAESVRDAAAQMAYDEEVRSELRQALTYPAVLVVAGLAAVVIMFGFVVPKFATLLERGGDLPWLAWAVLSSGTFIRAQWLWLAAGTLLSGAALYRAFAGPAGRQALPDLLERLPIVGRWRVEAETASWARVLATLLANKVPLMEALELAQAAVASRRRRARLNEARRAVKAGAGLAEALDEQAVLPASGASLIRVGVRSGELPAMLRSLAGLCDVAGKRRLKQFLTLLEPAAIVLIGGVVGVIMIGIILAITSANDLVL